MTNETQAKGKEEAILEIIVQRTLRKTTHFQVPLPRSLKLMFLFTYLTALVTKCFNAKNAIK